MRISGTAKGWRRLFSGGEKSRHGSIQNLDVGDRFYEVAPPHSVWVVDRFVKSQVCTIPHVMIERAGVMASSKIISTQVLLDPSVFRRDRREAADKAVSDKRRRKNDLPLKGGVH